MTDKQQQLGRGAWIGWNATRLGYTVTVYDPESIEVERYDAGNSPLDSQIYLALDAKEARLPIKTLRKYARQTAGEFAAGYGINEVMIHQEEAED